VRITSHIRQGDSVPSAGGRPAVEAGSIQGWRKHVCDEGDVIGVHSFGASAPWEVVMHKYGFTVETSANGPWS
jgi:transketolase